MFSRSGPYVCFKDIIILISLLTISQAYVNVALNKTAYQQHPHITGHHKFDSSNALDGRKFDLRRWGGHCAVSGDKKETATWWVDLTSVHSIHHITIHYMTNNEEWGPSNYYAQFFLGFSVYVSNSTYISKGTLCFKDTNFTLDTIPAIFTTTCHEHGQYVIYYNERLSGVIYPNGYSKYARNDLCEVEVFECDDGTFGRDCSGICGHCHGGAKCDKSTGMCVSGCAPGYKAIHCKQTCGSMRYGPNCELACQINCLNQTCDSKNGTCLETEPLVPVGVNNKTNVMIFVTGGSSGALCLLIIIGISLYKRNRRITNTSCQSFKPKKSEPNRITYENIDLRLNINESSRCMVLIERHLNATDRNGYEQFHSESSAEEMYTYEELLPGIPKCGIGFITMETEEKTIRTEVIQSCPRRKLAITSTYILMVYFNTISTTVITEIKEVPRTLLSNIPRTSSVNYQIRNNYLSRSDHEEMRYDNILQQFMPSTE